MTTETDHQGLHGSNCPADLRDLDGEAEDIALAFAAPPAKPSGHSRPRILIVDDEPTAILALHAALEGMADLRFATSGAESLRRVANERFDLVLLDAKMPEMDGFATCRALRHRHPEVPVIFVTAAAHADNELRALELGACDFLSKPINPRLVQARVGLHLELKEQRDRLREISGRDPLTGLANRRVLDMRVQQEWRRAARTGQPLGLLMADIDHFKAYNDHYGHIQGDLCLQQVAHALAESLTRAGDTVARYGGEEFAVLLPGSRLEAAVALGEMSAAAVRSLNLVHAYSSAAPYVTLSIGATSVIPPAKQQALGRRSGASAKTPESGFCCARGLFEAADRALYQAKHEGRDRVCGSPTVLDC